MKPKCPTCGSTLKFEGNHDRLFEQAIECSCAGCAVHGYGYNDADAHQNFLIANKQQRGSSHEKGRNEVRNKARAN